MRKSVKFQRLSPPHLGINPVNEEIKITVAINISECGAGEGAALIDDVTKIWNFEWSVSTFLDESRSARRTGVSEEKGVTGSIADE